MKYAALPAGTVAAYLVGRIPHDGPVCRAMSTTVPLQIDRVDQIDALTARIRAYTQLTDAEAAVIAALQGPPLRLRRGEMLAQEGTHTLALFVLCAGALVASVASPSGTRQILRVHHPGDVMNTSALGWARTSATLTAVLPSEVAPVSRADFGDLFTRMPRLAALFHGISVAENIVLSDQLAALGRTDGRSRIALLLLQLHARQHIGRADLPPDTLALFLSQSEIGDATGLTKVHVNRVLHQMDVDGLTRRNGRIVQLLDRPRLTAISGFVDRFTELDTNWMPADRSEFATVT